MHVCSTPSIHKLKTTPYTGTGYLKCLKVFDPLFIKGSARLIPVPDEFLVTSYGFNNQCLVAMFALTILSFNEKRVESASNNVPLDAGNHFNEIQLGPSLLVVLFHSKFSNLDHMRVIRVHHFWLRNRNRKKAFVCILLKSVEFSTNSSEFPKSVRILSN